MTSGGAGKTAGKENAGIKTYLSEFRFPSPDEEWQFFAGRRRTCYDSYYPFQVLAPRGVERLIETIQTFPYGEGLRVPKILLVSPIHMGPEIDRSEYASFDAESGERVKGLAAQYAASAEKYGCAFLNAAEVAKPGPDQLHMDAEGHRTLAEALAPLVRSLI